MDYVMGVAFGFLAGTLMMWLAAWSVIQAQRRELERSWTRIAFLEAQIAPFDGDGDGRIGGSKRR